MGHLGSANIDDWVPAYRTSWPNQQMPSADVPMVFGEHFLSAEFASDREEGEGCILNGTTECRGNELLWLKT